MTLLAEVDNTGQLRFKAVCAACRIPLVNPSDGLLAYRKRGQVRPQFLHTSCRKMFGRLHPGKDWAYTKATALGDSLGF